MRQLTTVLLCLLAITGCASAFPEEITPGGPVKTTAMHRPELPRCGDVTIHPQQGKKRDTECAF